MITTLRPNGGGGAAQHLRNGGTTNWGRVSEASQDGDTTYNYRTTLLNATPSIFIDNFALSDPPAFAGTILGVTAFVVAKYATKTVMADITVLIRVASTYYGGAQTNLTGAYAVYSNTWAVNPATGLAWTWSEIVGLQMGYQSTLQDDAIGVTEDRITQCYVEVSHYRTFYPGLGQRSLVGIQPGFLKMQGARPTEIVDMQAYVNRATDITGNVTRTNDMAAFVNRAVDWEVER